MDFSAPHAGLVIISYLVSAICLVGLCLVTIRRDRALTKKIDKSNVKEVE